LSVPSVVNFTYLSQYEPNVVLANVRIARINDGAFLEFCAQVRGFHPAIIVMDADPHEKSALKRQGVAGFLTLPFYVDDLVACVEHCQAGQGHR
jgi:DNA-binding NtrC family response regulator